MEAAVIVAFIGFLGTVIAAWLKEKVRANNQA
jgi:hypothetical protein